MLAILAEHGLRFIIVDGARQGRGEGQETLGRWLTQDAAERERCEGSIATLGHDSTLEAYPTVVRGAATLSVRNVTIQRADGRVSSVSRNKSRRPSKGGPIR